MTRKEQYEAKALFMNPQEWLKVWEMCHKPIQPVVTTWWAETWLGPAWLDVQTPAPRYNDVFFAGLEWLDSL